MDTEPTERVNSRAGIGPKRWDVLAIALLFSKLANPSQNGRGTRRRASSCRPKWQIIINELFLFKIYLDGGQNGVLHVKELSLKPAGHAGNIQKSLNKKLRPAFRSRHACCICIALFSRHRLSIGRMALVTKRS
jgi:hypothetical protein